MPLNHHPLIKEFPEHKDQIHKLKMEDNHFANLMKKYEDIDKRIFRIESDEEPSGDQQIHELKKIRLKLKDDLYGFIKEA